MCLSCALALLLMCERPHTRPLIPLIELQVIKDTKLLSCRRNRGWHLLHRYTPFTSGGMVQDTVRIYTNIQNEDYQIEFLPSVSNFGRQLVRCGLATPQAVAWLHRLRLWIARVFYMFFAHISYESPTNVV